jgi:hypothetical protein
MWVQRQGGWKSPHVLLTTYAHFLPTEIHGYADAIAKVRTASDGPIRPWAEGRGSREKLANSKNVARTPVPFPREGLHVIPGNAVSRRSDTAFEDASNTQLPSHVLNLDRTILVRESRVAGDDEHARDLA